MTADYATLEIAQALHEAGYRGQFPMTIWTLPQDPDMGHPNRYDLVYRGFEPRGDRQWYAAPTLTAVLDWLPMQGWFWEKTGLHNYRALWGIMGPHSVEVTGNDGWQMVAAVLERMKAVTQEGPR